METEKLHKVLARTGLGSRRELEKWITAGRITVDGKLAKLGERVSAKTIIRIDGRIFDCNEKRPTDIRIILYNKPAGEICTRHDDEDRPTVYSALPLLKQGKWISIGRLDVNTSGLLLFTNNGDLAHRLMHPRFDFEREYAVRVLGEVSEPILQRLLQGVHLEDGWGRFEQLRDAGGQGANHWYHVVMTEGRNRIVKRLWESQGITVSRLIRIRFGPILLPRDLPPCGWQELSPQAVQNMVKAKPGQSH